MCVCVSCVRLLGSRIHIEISCLFWALRLHIFQSVLISVDCVFQHIIATQSISYLTVNIMAVGKITIARTFCRLIHSIPHTDINVPFTKSKIACLNPRIKAIKINLIRMNERDFPFMYACVGYIFFSFALFSIPSVFGNARGVCVCVSCVLRCFDNNNAACK